MVWVGAGVGPDRVEGVGLVDRSSPRGCAGRGRVWSRAPSACANRCSAARTVLTGMSSLSTRSPPPQQSLLHPGTLGWGVGADGVDDLVLRVDCGGQMGWNEKGVHRSVRMAGGVAHRGPPRLPPGCVAPQHVESPTPTGGARARRGSPIGRCCPGRGESGPPGRRRVGRVRPGYADGRAGMGGQPQRGRPVSGSAINQRHWGGLASGHRRYRPSARPCTPATPQAGLPGRARPTRARPTPTSRSQPPRRPTRCWARASRSNTRPSQPTTPGRSATSSRVAPVEQLVQPILQLVEPRIVELPSHRQQLHLLNPDRHWCIDGHWRVLRHPCSPSARVTRAVMPPRVRDGRTTIAVAPGGVPTRDGSPLSRAGH